MIISSFVVANITNKMTKLTSNIAICFLLPICMKFMKTSRTYIKILLALQQEVRIYAGVRLQVDVGNRQAKKIFQSVGELLWKKT